MADWERANDDVTASAARVYTRLGLGVVAAVAANVILFGCLVVLFALGSTSERARWGLSYVALGFGAFQWPVLVPIAGYGVLRRAPFALGLVIGGIVVTLLNTACSTWLVAQAGWFGG